jgi:hypothetical protein
VVLVLLCTLASSVRGVSDAGTGAVSNAGSGEEVSDARVPDDAEADAVRDDTNSEAEPEVALDVESDAVLGDGEADALSVDAMSPAVSEDDARSDEITATLSGDASA